MGDSDEQWTPNQRISVEQSNKSSYPRSRSFRREAKSSFPSTSSSPLSDIPESSDVQTQDRVSLRNVIKMSIQDSANTSPSSITPASKALSTSRKSAKPKPAPVVGGMVGDHNSGQGGDELAFEPMVYKTPKAPTQDLRLPPKKKAKRTTLTPEIERRKIKTQLPEVSSPAAEGERVSCTSIQEQRDSPPVVNSNLVDPLPLNRRRPAPEPALADKRPSKRFKEMAPPGTIEVQTGSCHSQKYKHTKRCTACIAKKTGEPCRFRDIRAFLISNDGLPKGPPIFQGITAAPHQATLVQPQFNELWYNDPGTVDIQHVKTSAARIMLPILLEERKALKGRESQVVRRSREVEVRVTCDRCLTSVFSTSFICTECGREFCLECFASVESMDGATTASLHPKLVSCGMFKSGIIHGSGSFLPVSRLAISDLDESILEMEMLLANHIDPSPLVDISSLVFTALETRMAIVEQTEEKLKMLTDEANTHGEGIKFKPMTPAVLEPCNPVSTTPLDAPIVTLATPWTLPVISSTLSPSTTPRSVSTLTPLPESRSLSPPPPLEISGMPKDPTGIKSLSVPTFHHDELSDEVFQLLWAGGETVVVTDLLHKMNIKWSPQYFIDHYGESECAITDCDTETVRQSDVQSFFEQFGKYSSRDGAILKLKDWPPTADFKNAFPALFDDFHRAVPAPNYTRRDGFYNISAHFPMNAVVPDMGPKMYNAFKSRENGYGSTRLHMDMADAVNIMLYSTPLPGDTVGYAVWDIYPSTFSSKIRTFLKEEFPVESSPVQYVDPIHSQYFYLTPLLRKKLFDKYGVRSWRIYQKPGDAVFIPAGCAHQVCNLADCIKVAVDFVSPENLSRCGQLTKEFRSENEKVTWKEDVLQLSNMCWSAWENTRQMEKSMKIHAEAS